MKVLVILLLGLSIIWTADATASPASLPEISSTLDQQCGSYCYSVLRTLMQSREQAKQDIDASTITIQNKDEQIKELEAKINELEAKQSMETEHEDKIQSSDDLMSSISQKIDAIRNKVRDISQINSGTKELQK